MALVKLTAKNQISLPKRLLAQLPTTRYFEINVEGGRLILRPVRVEEIKTGAESARRRLVDIIGSGPAVFRTSDEVDVHLERLRSEWVE